MVEIGTFFIAVYLAKALGAGVVGGLLSALARRFDRGFLGLWAWSWWALAAYYAGVILSFRITSHWDPASPWRTAAAALFLVPGYLHIVWLVGGVQAFCLGKPPSRRSLQRHAVLILLPGALGLLCFHFLSGTQADRYFFTHGLRALTAGLALLGSGAFVLWAAGRRRTLGSGLVAAAFLAYALNLMIYFTNMALAVVGVEWIATVHLVSYVSLLDLVLLVVVGLGMVVWVLESEREQVVRAMQEAQRAMGERRKVEESLRRSQRLDSLGRLAGGMAHDFNNFLTTILGSVGMARLTPGEPRATARYLEQIQDSANRAAGLTRKLLALARRQVVEPRVFDLRDHILDMEDLLRRLLGNGIGLHVARPHEPVYVTADPQQLEQVVLNLVVNARDAMSEGGRLLIEMEPVDLGSPGNPAGDLRPGRYIRLSVQDNGSGMSEDVQKHLFEPFFTTKEAGSGTGLGLAIAYGIVKQSGGDIRVESREGNGTRFDVFLPPGLPHQDGVSPGGNRRDSGAEPGRPRILVVEDEAVVREFTQVVLESQGYEVVAAANGEEALRLVSDSGIVVDLVVSDVVMPRMSGFQLVEHLRRKWPRLPAILMSAYPDNAPSDDGLGRDFARFLAKPFDADTLLGRVREAIEASRRESREPVTRGGHVAS